jgi:hypothetical protein
MPFLPSQSLSNAFHRGLAAPKILFRLAPDYFINRHRKRGVDLVPALGSDQKLVLCHLCGFALARLQLSEGWLMEACSATGFRRVANDRAFAQWVKGLGACQKEETIIELKVGKSILPVAADSSISTH